MKIDYKKEVSGKLETIDQEIYKIENEIRDVEEKKKNINVTIEKSVQQKVKKINELKSNIENSEKILKAKNEELEMKEKIIAHQEEKIRNLNEQIGEFDNDYDLIEMSYQMQKDKFDQNEVEKERLGTIYKIVKTLVS